jgi:hypothetical protein
MNDQTSFMVMMLSGLTHTNLFFRRSKVTSELFAAPFFRPKGELWHFGFNGHYQSHHDHNDSFHYRNEFIKDIQRGLMTHRMERDADGASPAITNSKGAKPSSAVQCVHFPLQP